jgi:hypothetical protein
VAPNREVVLLLLSDRGRGAVEESSGFVSFGFGCWSVVFGIDESEDSGLEAWVIGAKLKALFAGSSVDSGAGLSAGDV